ERDDINPLQPHDAERLGPTPVVADAHADDSVKGAPHPEPLVADLEVALFEMLERRIGQVLRMPREVNLAVAPNDPPVGLDEDRGVVTTDLASLLRQLGIAKIKADPELPRQIEQGQG